VIDLLNTEGFVSYVSGSGVTKLIDYLIVFPLTSAFLVSWHRYVLFNGKRPWKYAPVDFSKYTINFIWTTIKILIIFIIPAIAFMVFIWWLSINFLGTGFLSVGIFFYLLVAIVYFVRIAIIFPATAVGENNSINRIFKLTKNSFWQLLLINISFIFLLICFVLLHFIFEVIYPSEGRVLTSMLYASYSLVYIFICYGYLAVCLSESYRHLR